MSPKDFLQRFPDAVESGKLSARLLEEAEQGRNGEDLGCAMVVGFTFGFAEKHCAVLCRLMDANWHTDHENLVGALEGIGIKNQTTIDALVKATETRPTYLDYDEFRALAVKAIWALAKMEIPAADEKLAGIAKSEDPILRREATNQLHRRGIIKAT
jgi:hypothetical protein